MFPKKLQTLLLVLACLNLVINPITCARKSTDKYLSLGHSNGHHHHHRRKHDSDDSVTGWWSSDTTSEPTISPTPRPTYKPTPEPTKRPTVDLNHSPMQNPTYEACSIDYRADIVFIVSNSCKNDFYECENQQTVVSRVFQGIKGAANPRIGYIECDGNIDIKAGDNADDYVVVSMDDEYYNTKNGFSSANLMEYFATVSSRTCTTSVRNPIGDCINRAFGEFDYKSKNTQKKIIVFSKCDEVSGRLSAFGAKINKKLLAKEISVQYFDFRIKQEEYIEKFIDDICREQTDEPSHSPTILPTPSPTFLPTPFPTYQACYFHERSDIFIIGGNSCKTSRKYCSHKQQYLSELLQHIKRRGMNPRVGYMACDGHQSFFGQKIDIPIIGGKYNDISTTSADLRQMFDFVRDEKCFVADVNPMADCIDRAISAFDYGPKHRSSRTRTLIVINNCEDYGSRNAIDTDYIRQRLKTNHVQCYAINMGPHVPRGYLDDICEPYHIRPIANKDKKKKKDLVNAICSETVDVPSESTTRQPKWYSTRRRTKLTKRPTRKPTPRPTRRTTESPTWWHSK